MPRSHEQLTDFVATIKKPDRIEALSIVAAQMKNPNRQVMCIFNAGEENQYSITRIPNRHAKYKMEDEMFKLFDDMQRADFVQIIDVSDR